MISENNHIPNVKNINILESCKAQIIESLKEKESNGEQMNLTDKEKFVSEMALRIVLRELLQKDQQMIDTVTASAHNLAIGCFGDKEFKPEKTEDWIQFLQPMRDLIDKLDPDYRKSCDALGDSHYKLPEENK